LYCAIDEDQRDIDEKAENVDENFSEVSTLAVIYCDVEYSRIIIRMLASI